jgi:Haemolymph juvenile hormone binding protein (JHBP)
VKIKGIPELGLFQLDPMKIEVLNVTQETGPVSVFINFINLELLGLAKAKIYKISGFNKDSNSLEIRFKTPLAQCISPYKVSGKILIIPLSGEGNSKLVFG